MHRVDGFLGTASYYLELKLKNFIEISYLNKNFINFLKEWFDSIFILVFMNHHEAGFLCKTWKENNLDIKCITSFTDAILFLSHTEKKFQS